MKLEWNRSNRVRSDLIGLENRWKISVDRNFCSRYIVSSQSCKLSNTHYVQSKAAGP